MSEHTRKSFEQWITSCPIEASSDRYSENPVAVAFPGHYRDYKVQLAWEAWQESCNAHALLVEACKAARAELHCCAGQALARGHGNAGLARVINQLSAALAAVGE